MKKRPSVNARARPEKAELTRQGAKAAAREEAPPVNPLDAAESSPMSTGEPLNDWLMRRKAWPTGYASNSMMDTSLKSPMSGPSRR